MPYKNLTELPKRVKDTLPTEAQRVWLDVFNSTYKSCTGNSGKDCDTRASIAAWVVVKRNWKQDKEGKWVKKT